MRTIRLVALAVLATACTPVLPGPFPGRAPAPAPAATPAPPVTVVPPAPAVAPAAVSSPARTVDVPSAIAADCSTDVTRPLAAWIASVSDSSTLRFGAGACYRVDGTLWITNRHHVALEGNQATFRAFTDGRELGDPLAVRSRAMFHVANSSDVTLRNLVVRGANPVAGRAEAAYQPRFEAQHAFVIDTSHTVMLDRVQAYDVYGDFVDVGWQSSDVTVQRSQFARNGRQGWTVNGANVLIQGNSITEVRRSTVDMEPALPTWATSNVVIRDNTVGPGRLLFFASLGAAASIQNVTVSGNRLLGRPLTFKIDPPTSGTRSSYHIVDNTSDRAVSRPGGGALILHDLSNVEVRGNVVPVQAGRGIYGVQINNCRHVVVTNNTFANATGPVLDLGNGVDVSQSGNRVGWPMRTMPGTWSAGPTPVVGR